jgi:pilus assembly protein CpaF
MRTGEALASDVRAWLVQNAAAADPAAVLAALAHQGAVVGAGQLLDVLSVLRAELQGAGPLQDMLDAGGCTDVLVNGAEAVWVDDGSGLRRVPSPFADNAAVRRLAQRLAAAAGRRLDDAAPFCDARLPDGTRFHAALDPVASPGTLVSLRLPAQQHFDLDDLVAGGALPDSAVPWMRGLIASRSTFLISGGTGSGKTTVLQCLLSLVPPEERLVILEDSAELRPQHPHVCSLQGRPANIEGEGALHLADLVRQAMRMRPDRLVVGEVRGAEVVAMLAAFNTGHDGGAGTIHASAAERVPERLEALALAAGLGRSAAHAQIAAGIDAVVHLSRQRGGRRIEGIAALQRTSQGFTRAEPALLFEADGVRTVGEWDLIQRIGDARC